MSATKEYTTLPSNTSIAKLRELCGWDREPQEGDYDLIGHDEHGNYLLSRVIAVVKEPVVKP